MNCLIIIFIVICVTFINGEECCDGKEISTAEKHARMVNWSTQKRISMSLPSPSISDFGEARKGNTRGKLKVKKKLKKLLLPLLLAYKLKFFTLIPVLIGGLILLKGATALAGFFFALFAAVMGLKSGGSH